MRATSNTLGTRARGARLDAIRVLALVTGLAATFPAFAGDGNRLTYLDGADPFHVGLQFPRLSTPQWVGEPGVEAVVIMAVDDMKEPAKYETFLRPLLDRLKQIDGRAPVSIMSTAIKPLDEQYPKWLAEGLSLECHTMTHPCPILASNDFAAAAKTFFGNIDLLDQVPGNHAVAFRTPCCDSMNSPSPRLFAELLNQVAPSGRFLSIDSSVMNILSPDDKSLPRELVTDADGREKFRKYLPFPAFKTTIENYPYPYVVGSLCWEFPAAVPSDWEAFHIQGATNPVTVADWKAGVDATVLKQGVFTMIFHPHGWIRSDQLVELADYASKKHGAKVKFLNFREAEERLEKNLLGGQPLRAANGQDNGVRLVDLNNDGYLDVVIANEKVRKTRIWNPHDNSWIESDFPTPLVTVDADGARHDAGVRFGVLSADGYATALVRTESASGAWRFDGRKWVAETSLLRGLELDGQTVMTSRGQRDRGARLRDVNKDGICEFIIGNESQSAVFAWSQAKKQWTKLAYALPLGTSVVDEQGRDNGLRFVDINEDGYDDVIFSNAKSFSLHLFIPEAILGWKPGWSREVSTGQRGDPGEIPMIVRDGPQRDNGAWFHSESLWVQNEDTAKKPDLVDRRSYKELLAGALAPAKSPQESLESIRVRPGFKVELVANEPVIRSPVAFDWSADGRLWVVEMIDYPLGLDGDGKPGGKVIVLEDTKGDGHYDKSSVFLDGLNFPNGIMPWRKGVLVSAPPDLIYAEDTNGDGKADVRRTLFTGFREGNQQHRANGFDYGLDNWLYGANGDSGGRVKSILTGKSVDISHRDFRFRPDTGEFETQEGQAQFGRHRDDWGNWFANENAVGAWHYFLPEQYLARNPRLAATSMKQTMPNYPDYTRVYPASRLAQRFNDPIGANHLTSANSATPYRDDIFGPDFATSYFVSEPVHNLIHREILEPDGVSFTSQRAPDEQTNEFLASTDNWFRPAMTKTGPDGALYLVDVYRQIIEHPEWIPMDFQRSVNLRAGEDMGRIYRVYPEGAALRKFSRLDKLDTAGLVAAMESPSGWRRDTVQRLLVESGDISAAPGLRQLVETSPNAKTRVQALCALDGLHALTTEIILAALKDADPHVREHAIRVSEPFLPKSATLGDALAAMARDPDTRVRYQLAFSLGEWPNPRAGRALAEIALNDSAIERIQTAVMSSATRQLDEMIAAALERRPVSGAQGKLLEQLAGFAVSLNDQPALAKTFDALLQLGGARHEAWQFAAFNGLLDALDGQGSSLERLESGGNGELKKFRTRLDGFFASARATAADTGAPEPDRVAATRLLGRGLSRRDADLNDLGRLLGPQNPQEVQNAALSALIQTGAARVAAILLDAWKSESPALRARILDSLLTRQEWVQSLLAGVEAGKIPAGSIGTPRQQRLLNHPEPAIHDRAGKLFAAASSDRQGVLKRYEGVVDLKGNPAKGAELFRQNCAICHRLNNEGKEIGPDLGSVSFKPVDYLVTAILDPNQSFEDRYTSYTAVTARDQEFTGVVANESANSLTLRLPGGTEAVILRAELKELTSSGRSLMPEGFENGLDPQAIADLISHIKSAAKPVRPPGF